MCHRLCASKDNPCKLGTEYERERLAGGYAAVFVQEFPHSKRPIDSNPHLPVMGTFDAALKRAILNIEGKLDQTVPRVFEDNISRDRIADTGALRRNAG